MKQIFLGAFIVAVTALSACTDDSRPADDAAAKAAADSAAAPAMLAQPSTTPTTQPGAVNANPATGSTAATTPAEGALNPPHGQPNHRCDIPVGAPLNSPPGANTTPMPSSGTPIQVTPGNGGQSIQMSPQNVQVNPQTTPANPQTAPTKP